MMEHLKKIMSIDPELALHTIESVRDLILWMDGQGRISYANQGALELLGYSAKELAELSIFQVQTNFQKENWGSLFSQIEKEKSLGGLGAFTKKKGEQIMLRYNLNSLKPFKGDKYLCLIGRVSSIRSLQKEEKAFDEEYYKTILNYAGDPIFVKDREHRMVFVNEACRKALGAKTLEERLGTTDYDHFPKEEADVFWARDEKVFETGEDDINVEKFTPDNSPTLVILTKKSLYVDPKGQKYIVGVSQDITKLKKIEEELQKVNELLEQKVKVRTRELEEANRGMELRIQQLEYLNKNGHSLAERVLRKDVLKSIFSIFSDRFKNGEVHLVLVKAGEFESIRNTKGLNSASIKNNCLEALNKTPNKLSLSYEANWKLNKDLKSCLPDVLKKYPAYLVCPLVSKNVLLGVVQIFAPEEYNTQFQQEYYMLDTLAAHAAVSLDNANQRRQLEKKTRIESELAVARRIQAQYIPEDPHIPNVDIKGLCRPANEVGGDYLDYFQNENGDWIFVIADVCGKGIPAALMMTSLRSCVRTEGKNAASAKELLVSVNRLLGEELQRERSFITCMCVVLNKDGRTMSYSRAGHPHLLMYNGTKEPEPIACKGIAMGIILGDAFEALIEEKIITLASGTKFFAYTDGLDETMNSKKEVYGIERLFKVLTEKMGANPGDLIQFILEDISRYAKGQRQHDDLTMLAIEKNSVP